ncbi:MAG: ABC transporter permease [Burkholderiales bacterium]
MRLALTALPGILKTDVALAFRNVVRQRRRSLIGVLSVAFGVVCLILAAGFIEWVFWAMREGVIQSRIGHIQVVRPGYLESGQADPFAFLLSDSAPQREAIEQFPGVKAIAPRLLFNGLASLGDSTISFIAEGVSPEREGGRRHYVLILEGQDLAADDPKGITLGQGLATNLGAKIGDKLVLVANTRTGGINAVEVTVRGVFATDTKAFDDAALRVPLPLAQELLRVSGSHMWVIRLDDTDRTREIRNALEARFGKDLEFVPWYGLADFYNKTVALFSKQVGVMRLIIAFIIVLSILNTQMMSVLERTSEIGTSMALGVTRAQTLRRFLLESLAIGLIGGLLGLAVGLLLALLISAIGIPMPPPPGMARSFIGEIRVTWPLAADAISLALITTLLAGIYPAWKASRMEIVDALRHAH